MNQKRHYRRYNQQFKEETVGLVIEQGYSVVDAASSRESAVLMEAEVGRSKVG